MMTLLPGGVPWASGARTGASAPQQTNRLLLTDSLQLTSAHRAGLAGRT